MINLDKDDALEFFSGYVVSHRERFSKCLDCHKALIASSEDEMSDYFKSRNEFGVLHQPSGVLVALLEVSNTNVIFILIIG